MSTITKAQFVSQGNAICKKAARQREAIEKRWFEEKSKGDGKASQAEGEALYVEMVVPHLEGMVGELEDLDDPDSGAKAATAINTSFSRAIEKFQADPSPTFKLEEDPFEDARKKATAFGLKECAEF